MSGLDLIKPTFMRTDSDEAKNASAPLPYESRRNSRMAAKELERHVRMLEDIRRHEHDKVQQYLKNAGWKHDPKKNAFDEMMLYCNHIMDERNNFYKRLQDRDLEFKAATADASRLEAELKVLARELESARQVIRVNNEGEKRSHEKMLQSHEQEMAVVRRALEDRRAEYENQTRQMVAAFERDLAGVKDQLTQENASLKAYHVKAMSALQMAADEQLSQFICQADDETRDLREQIKDLEGGLLSQADDFRPATDEALRVKFRDLASLVAKVTLPHNLNLSPVVKIPSELDPNDFLSRQGPNRLCFLLRSLFWDVIVESFFSLPLGFGCLGQGAGRDILLDIKSSWQRLYTSGAGSTSPSNAERHALDLFETDFEANKWRSALFQSVQVAATAGSPIGKPKTLVAKLHSENCDVALGKILAILDQVTGYRTPEPVISECWKLTRTAALLALDISCQRARVELSIYHRGDMVATGADVYDCIGGGFARADRPVELSVSPGLEKLGDGRGDMAQRRVLVPAEVYCTDS